MENLKMEYIRVNEEVKQIQQVISMQVAEGEIEFAKKSTDLLLKELDNLERINRQMLMY